VAWTSNSVGSRVGWGIIGTGDVSRFIAPDFAAVPTTYLRAIGSRSLERAQSFAAEFGVEQAYGSIDAMLQDDLVDAVYIATPHGTHHDIALSALRAGKHILVEKPFVVDRAQARSIAAAAEEAHRFAMEAMWMKFTPAYQRMLGEIENGAIGEPRSVRASFGIASPSDRVRRWSAELESSTLLDQGIYAVTLALHLFGTPTKIAVNGIVRPDGVDLSEHVTLEFGNGRFAQIAASMVDFIDPSATINGTFGWIHLPWPFWNAARCDVYSGESTETLLAPRVVEIAREGNGFVPMIDGVNWAILNGRREHELHPMSEVIAIFGVLDDIRVALNATWA
jgi:predicted dehydrogenase